MGTQADLRFSDLIGQTEVITRLEAYSEFYSSAGGTPGHILLIGEEGMGQSRIAKTLANERGVPFWMAEAAELVVSGDVTAILTNLRANQVFLLSGIQGLRKIHWQNLLSAMRHRKLPIVIGTGPAARTHVMDVKPFTLVATCPRKSDCPAALVEEFSLVLAMQAYSAEEIELLAHQVAKRENLHLEQMAAQLMARHSERRPRSAEATVLRIARAVNKSLISEDDVRRVLSLSG
jgi:Holliday junction DNA helicase RuvB